ELMEITVQYVSEQLVQEGRYSPHYTGGAADFSIVRVEPVFVNLLESAEGELRDLMCGKNAATLQADLAELLDPDKFTPNYNPFASSEHKSPLIRQYLGLHATIAAMRHNGTTLLNVGAKIDEA